MGKYSWLIRRLAADKGIKTADLAAATEKLIGMQEEADGGPGSGNFGHAGRPGKRGGSAKKGGGSAGSVGGSIGGNAGSAGSVGGAVGASSMREPGKSVSMASGKKKSAGGSISSPAEMRNYWSDRNAEYVKKAMNRWEPDEKALALLDAAPEGSTIEVTERATGMWEGDEDQRLTFTKRIDRNGEGVWVCMDESGHFGPYKGLSSDAVFDVVAANNQTVRNYGLEDPDVKIDLSGWQNVAKTSRAINKKNLKEENLSMADECRKRAKEWPEGSQERHIYEMYSDILSKPLSGRPTPEQSKALTEKFLGNISSQLKPYAVERYKRDLADEPNITSDLCDIADELGTSMFGLDFRLKKASNSSDGGCRIAEKIDEDIQKKGMTYEQAVDNLSDMVRYTQACTRRNMVDNYNKTMRMLTSAGYKVVKVKNSWNNFSLDRAYRGVNCVLESPNGTRFELQFHTPESLVGKEVQHGQYEEQRSPNTPEERKQELGMIMYKNMERMKAPERIDEIEPYPPDSM